MTSKSKVMGNLGGADGAVLRCLDILQSTYTNATHGVRIKLRNDEIKEIMAKLDTAHQSILIAAHEIDGKGEDL